MIDRLFIHRILNELIFDIELLEFSSAEKVLTHLSSSPNTSFTHIIIDNGLPGMSGLELLTKLDAMGLVDNKKIALVYGLEDNNIVDRISHINSLSCFLKPLDRTQILDFLS